MPELSDAQLIILSAAAHRDDRNLLPLPGSLRGGAAAKVVGALLKRGLAAETASDSMVTADTALNRFWRNDDEGRAILLRITNAGLAAIGCHLPEAAPSAHDAPDVANDANDANDREHDAPEAPEAPGEPDAANEADAPQRTRADSKQARLIAMLRSPEGVTIAEVTAALDWQPHTVRGAIAGALKKKLGLDVTSDKVEGRGRVYRLPQEG